MFITFFTFLFGVNANAKNLDSNTYTGSWYSGKGMVILNIDNKEFLLVDDKTYELLYNKIQDYHDVRKKQIKQVISGKDILDSLNKSIYLSTVPGYEDNPSSKAEIAYIKEIISELKIKENQQYTSFQSAIPPYDNDNIEQKSVIVFINNKLLFFPAGMNPEFWMAETAYPKIFNKLK